MELLTPGYDGLIFYQSIAATAIICLLITAISIIRTDLFKQGEKIGFFLLALLLPILGSVIYLFVLNKKEKQYK